MEMAALEVRSITKSFPATRALDGVTLAFQPGEIHGIVGENGAGKSTLMKIMAGLQAPDSGSMILRGREVRWRNVRDAIAGGIAMIHQELNLVDDLSVAENIALGREPMRFGLVDQRRMRRDAEQLLALVGGASGVAAIDPRRRVGELAVADQQLVEIAKALACDARILIMDEPTAVLSERETTALFALVRELSRKGVTVLYISHLLPEVLRLCHRISVLRDGALVGTVRPADLDEAALASMMVGRAMTEVFPPRRPPTETRPALEVQSLRGGPLVRDMSFSIAPGEIVGLAGLVGSGRTESAEMIVGLRPRESGIVRVQGRAVRFSGPRSALAAGVAYVSEDRKGRGVLLDMSSIENLTLPHLGDFGGFLGRSFPSRFKERAATAVWMDRLAIRCHDPRQPIRMLSGGNQQKFAVAKWLDALPAQGVRTILLDEPTRGIDLGAKREMYRLIADLAGRGLACLLISSELPELLGLAHRIVVVRNGVSVGVFDAATTSEEELMHAAAGVTGRAHRSEERRTA